MPARDQQLLLQRCCLLRALRCLRLPVVGLPTEGLQLCCCLRACRGVCACVCVYVCEHVQVCVCVCEHARVCMRVHISVMKHVDLT